MINFAIQVSNISEINEQTKFRQSNKWYHCDDKHITETNLLTLSNNVYLMFYAKEVDLGT